MPEHERKIARLREQKAAYMRRKRKQQFDNGDQDQHRVTYWAELLGEDLRERLIKEVHDEMELQ